MTWQRSDWLVVLCGRESRLHGEAASGSCIVRGKHGLHAKGGCGFYAKRRTVRHGNRTQTYSSKTSVTL